MRRNWLLLILVGFSTVFAIGEGTQTWEQSKFDDLTKGTANGVAIRSAGGLELAPAFKSVSTTASAYIWSIAADAQGNLYAAAGSPARVYRITPQGQSTVIFEPQELQVQALVVGKDGTVYAATNPDGKVYKLVRRSGAAPNPALRDKAESGKTVADSGWTSSVYFDPDTKYIWDLALDPSGNLYIATGDHGQIFRVVPTGQHSVFFTSDEPHIRVLALDSMGNVIAGSDGSGLIYRIAPDGKAFVLYSAPKKEITALAIDNAGNIYAAGVGEKRPSGPPPKMPVTPSQVPAVSQPGHSGAITMSATPTTPVFIGSFPMPGAGVTGGSEVYRIAPDGSPRSIWESNEDLVYALTFDSHGQLLAGTGNRGHIFAIGSEDEFSDLLQASASQVTGFAKAPDGGLYASTSNLGKIFLIGAAPEAEGSYESDVFDAHIFSRWGRVEFRGAGTVDVFARSGNVNNPDRNWSPWEKVELEKGAAVTAPAARFVQWKAVLHSGNPAPRLESLTLNYLPKNVRPDFESVTVEVGVRYQPLPKVQPTPDGGKAGGQKQRFDQPPLAAPDSDSVGVKWAVHDDNDDQMVYSIYYRGDGQTRWLLLKDDLTDKFYSFDASLLPDGGYTVKVVASDAPSHSPGSALEAEREGAHFDLDTTPPRIEGLGAVVEGGRLHITFRAVDSFSPIKRAEFSVDASDWQFIAPVGQLSDAKEEGYDFRVPLPEVAAPDAAASGKAVSSEHVVVVRAYDRYDNMSSAKALVGSKSEK